MSMMLEQAIADCEEEISDCQIDLDGISKLLEEYPERKEAFAHEIDDYKKRMDYNRYLAEWLNELKAVKDLISQHDEDSMPEDFWYIDKIREAVQE
jgi:chromosome segregation ATPase